MIRRDIDFLMASGQNPSQTVFNWRGRVGQTTALPD